MLEEGDIPYNTRIKRGEAWRKTCKGKRKRAFAYSSPGKGREGKMSLRIRASSIRERREGGGVAYNFVHGGREGNSLFQFPGVQGKRRHGWRKD